MANRLLLVNPTTRRRTARAPQKRVGRAKRKTSVARKTRTAAQRAATRKMIAANRARRRGGARKRPARRTAKVRRRRNPVRRRTAAYRATPTMKRPARRRRNPRRAPKLTANYIINELLMPTAIGTGGALSVDLIVGQLPETVKGVPGSMQHTAVKGLAAVVLGVVAGFVVNPKTAAQLAMGGLITTAHQAARGFIDTQVPALGSRLDGYGMGLYVPYGGMAYYNPAMPAGGYDNMGLYVGGGRSASLPPGSDSLGNYAEFEENGYSYS